MTNNYFALNKSDSHNPLIRFHKGSSKIKNLAWNQVKNFIKLLTPKREIIGSDVVELCPIPGFVTLNFLTTKLVYQPLSYTFQKGERR